MLVELVTNRTERMSPGSVLSAGGRALEVERASVYRQRWRVSFAGVGDRAAAEELRGAILCAEAVGDEKVLWVHELIGASVEDVDRCRLGTVVAVEANPASDLLVLDDGSLVPLTFVVTSMEGRVVVDLPPGLVE